MSARQFASDLVVGTVVGSALVFVPMQLGTAIARATEPSETTTVDGTDYPVCSLEDCSDQLGVGVWRNDGHAWLIVGDATYPINPNK